MPLLIEDDPTHPQGGYALLRIPDKAEAAGTGEITIMVRRFKQGDSCLGPDGWQPAEYAFKPSAMATRGGELVLTIGPRIVDAVEEYEQVSVSIPEIGLQEAFPWPPLTPSRNIPVLDTESLATGDTAMPGGTEARSASAEPYRQTEVDRTREEVPLDLDPATLPGNADAIQKDPVEGETECRKDNGEATADTDTEHRRKAAPFRTRFLILALLLLAAVGALTYYYWDELAELAGFSGPDEPPSPPTPAPSSPSPVVTPMSSAERHARAMEDLEAGRFDEAIPLLRQNAREGYGPSLLSLAGYFADSNPAEALRLVTDACEAGATGATAFYDSLLEDVEAKADQGNALAVVALSTRGPSAAAACRP